MSTIKLEIKGNFLKITDNINNNNRLLIRGITKYDFKNNDTILLLKTEQGTNQVTNKYKVSVLVDETDTPFASLVALETFLSDNLGFSNGGGNGTGVTISQQAINYSAFVAGDNVGDLAYAEQSEGTSWLPGSLGGTYYPSGLYLWDGVNWVSSRDAISNQLELSKLDNRIHIRQDNAISILGGTIDPTKEYFLDGIIDMGSTSIEIPSGGINLKGYDFNVSGLVSSESNYTMFTSPTGGSGDILWQDFKVEVTGANSKMLDVFSDNGFKAYEIARINFNNCTSLGVIDNYRQGLETGTGRFGGTPELELKGVWLGGFFIDTSIVRVLSDGAYTLFKAGAGFSMASRFRSNQNVDLPASVSYLDFSPSNFVNPSTLQLTEMIITRNGVFNSTDSNYTPNISRTDLASIWKGNNGLPNTFEGGSIGVGAETTTTINTIGVFETINATSWNVLDLQHFDNPNGNQLRHLGNTPREFKVIADFSCESGANDVLTLRIRKWDDSISGYVTILDQNRQVNSLVGGRDIAFFSVNINTELDQNDYIELQIANQSSTANVTAENDSYYIIEQR